MESLKEQTKYVDLLPQNVVDSFLNYIVDSLDLNMNLRAMVNDDDLDDPDVKNIDCAFAHVPLTTEPFTVYRGQEEEIFDTRAYTSTSLDINVTIAFANAKSKCCLYKITVSPGSRVLPLQKLASQVNKKEEEVLLDRDGKFFITDIAEEIVSIRRYGKTRQHPIRVIYVTYMPGESEEV